MACCAGPNRFILAAVAALALAACDSGSDGGTDPSNSTDPVTSDPDPTPSVTTTLSGQVELVDNTTQAQGLGERLMGYVLPMAHAAITGLVEAPAGTEVRLVRINTTGDVVETLATGETEASGRFALEVPADLDLDRADLVIEAGPTDDPVRAPAAGDEIVVNPVSLSIVNKIVARVQSGDSAFADFRAADLANLVGVIIEELEARAEVVTFAASNSAAADQADDSAGTTDDDLLDDAANPPALATGTVGAKNVAILGIDFEVFPSEALVQANLLASSEALVVDLTEQRQIDLGGRATEEAEAERRWSIEEVDANTGQLELTTDAGNLFQAFSTIPAEADDDAFGLTIGSDGRLLAQGGALRGAIAGDGSVFFMTERRDDGVSRQGQALIAGASQWTPGDVTATFNFVKFDAYVDTGFTGEQWGYTSTLRGDADLACVAGDCSLALDRFSRAGGTERKFFAQAGPDGQLDTNDSSNDGVLTLDGVTLDAAGRFGGTSTVDGNLDFETRGFLAPDGQLLVVQMVGDDSTTLFHDLIVGLPQGTACDASTLNGRYNLVSLAGGLAEGGDANTPFDATFDLEGETLVVDADGAGALALQESRFRGVRLQFNDLNTSLTTEVTLAADESNIPYSVSADCRVTVADEAGDRVLGAVSPDGSMLVIATYEAGGSSTFQSILLGLRQPAQEAAQ